MMYYNIPPPTQGLPNWAGAVCSYTTIIFAGMDLLRQYLCLICSYLALFCIHNIYIYIQRERERDDVYAYNEGHPNRGPLTNPMTFGALLRRPHFGSRQPTAQT